MIEVGFGWRHLQPRERYAALEVGIEFILTCVDFFLHQLVYSYLVSLASNDLETIGKSRQDDIEDLVRTYLVTVIWL